MCTQMAAMGLGVDCKTCLLVVNAILSKRISAAEFTPVGIGKVKRIVARNSDLLCLVRGNLIDPKHVPQTDTDVLNAMFVKLDNMVKLLYKQGKVPQK